MSFMIFIHHKAELSQAKSDGAHSVRLTLLVDELAAGAPRPSLRSCRPAHVARPSGLLGRLLVRLLLGHLLLSEALRTFIHE